jgi:glucose/arabinose dehydrogenase
MRIRIGLVVVLVGVMTVGIVAGATVVWNGGGEPGSVSGVAGESQPPNFVRGVVGGFAVPNPTSLAFGPDGRLYVAQLDGAIFALTLDGEHREVTDVEVVATHEEFENVLGIAFSPVDDEDPVTLYVSSTKLNGAPEEDPFLGKVTRLTGEGFAERQDIITGLPSSTIIHGTNGIAFDQDGRLFIQQGSSTNAGVAAEGFRAETPLSGATLVADVYAPGFDGNVTYDPPGAASATVNQVGGDVRVFAYGMRNPYDIVVHSNGQIYGTDNGPNPDETGPTSTGCESQGVSPWTLDELNLIVEGGYYGHPNRNRARFDPRQCVFHSPEERGGPDRTGPLALLPISADGLVEYTSDAFDGEFEGDIFVVSWSTDVVSRIVLSPDGTSVVTNSEVAKDTEGGVDITMGPDGTLYIAEFSGDRIAFLAPEDE